MIDTSTTQILPAHLKPANLYLHFDDVVSNKTWKQLYQYKGECNVPLLVDMCRPIWVHFGKKYSFSAGV